EAHGHRAGTAGREADHAGDVQPAVAPAAARGLHENAARPIASGPHVARHAAHRRRRLTAAAAEAADPEGDATRAAVRGAQRGGHVDPAVSATTAERLHDEAGGILTDRLDDACYGPARAPRI